MNFWLDERPRITTTPRGFRVGDILINSTGSSTLVYRIIQNPFHEKRVLISVFWLPDRIMVTWDWDWDIDVDVSILRDGEFLT